MARRTAQKLIAGNWALRELKEAALVHFAKQT
jgi:hypothetical protein